MRNRKHLIAAAAACLLTAFAALSPGAISSQPAGAAPAAHDLADVISAAAPGDVLFKSDAGGFWGNMARAFSAGDARFGHVGIVVETRGGALAVIHAGGDPVSREGRVRADPIAGFLAGVEAAALYRPDATPLDLVLMVSYAQTAAARGAPFDRQFSLASEDRLYCTELVWRALAAAGAGDAAPQKSVRAGHIYISLEDLQMSPALRLIAESPPLAPGAGPGSAASGDAAP